MAREVVLGGRRFWIVSEPEGQGWRARVLELTDPQGQKTEEVGIDATGDTREAADNAAQRKLQRMMRVPERRG